MDTYNDFRERLILSLDNGSSYQSLADIFNVNRGIIWNIINNDDYEPAKFEVREKLGLHIFKKVIEIDGTITNGAQSMGSEICIKCNNSFIPNTAKRESCYTCVPFRERKK